MSRTTQKDKANLEAMLGWRTGRSDAPRGASRTVTTSFGSLSLAGFLSGSFVARPAGRLLDCSRALSAARFDCSTAVVTLSAVELFLLLGTMAPCMQPPCTAVMKCINRRAWTYSISSHESYKALYWQANAGAQTSWGCACSACRLSASAA